MKNIQILDNKTVLFETKLLNYRLNSTEKNNITYISGYIYIFDKDNYLLN